MIIITKCEKKGYNITVAYEVTKYLIKISDKDDNIIYTGSYDDYNDELIDKIFEEMEL